MQYACSAPPYRDPQASSTVQRPDQRRPACWSNQIAKIIPAAARPLRHRIGFAFGLCAVGQGDMNPVGGLRQRRLSAFRRFVIFHFRQFQRQVLFIHCQGLPILRMQDRERLSPVPLPTEQPVPQFVVNGLFAQSLLFQPGGDFLLKLQRR